MKSTTKVWVFLTLASFLTLFIGFKAFDRVGLLVGFLIAVTFIALILFSSRSILLKKLGAVEMVGQDSWGLHEKIVAWAHELSLKAPHLYLLDSPVAVAFSACSPWGDGAICLSEGILKKLTPQEIEAILVHQICHILHMDSFTFAVSSIMSDSLVTLADILDRAWPLRKVPRFSQHRPFQALLSPLAWFLIRLNIREATYFANDDLAAQILPDRKILAQALWKLESLNQARPLDIPICSSHLFVVNPRGIREQTWFYGTHPRMSARLKRIVGYEPL